MLLNSKQATEWIKLYLSLGGEVIGYENASVTPYFHILAYHLPRFIRDETPFKSFTGQGVEKINDTVRSIYHNKCNKHDACKEAILALKRIEHLQDVERQPHQYTKKKKMSTGKLTSLSKEERDHDCVLPQHKMMNHQLLRVMWTQ